MKQFLTLFCCAWLLVGLAASGSAQTIWAKQYEAGLSQYIGCLTPLQGGGYLLSGRTTAQSGNPSFLVYPTLYLVRTGANGDTIWTRRQALRRYSTLAMPSHGCEDNAGHILLAGTATIGQQQPFLLLLDKASGDTLWTRPTTGACAGITLAADQSFVVVLNEPTATKLVKVTAAGQVSPLANVSFSATDGGKCSAFLAVPGGYWLYQQAGTTNPASKFIFVDLAGTRGNEFAGPTGVTPNTLLAVENGNFLLVAYNQVLKFSPSFTVLWTCTAAAATSPNSLIPTLMQGRRTTNGEYVILGQTSTDHSLGLSGYVLSSQGTRVSSRSFFGFLNYGYSVNGMLHVDPTTGNFIVATSNLGSGLGQTHDFFLSAFTGSAVTAQTPRSTLLTRQAYPNPVGHAQVLMVEPGAPLSGSLVLTDELGRTLRSWSAQPKALRYDLSLQGPAAGPYLLHLTDANGLRSSRRIVKE